jgi:vitamin B12 transporter
MKISGLLPSVATAALAVVSPVLADDSTTLDPLLVTATRRAISVEAALPPVVIIGRAEIERSLAQDVAELLRFHAGIEVARNGGPGQLASVFIRGANSNHTLVLIDGVKVNPGTAGGAALQNIPPELVERIEIVKGPRSSLYGSEAIGGVIHIITRRGARGGELGATLQGGRYDTRGGSANASWQGESFGAGLSASSQRSDGFPTWRNSEDARGFENDVVNAWLRGRLGALELDASHWQGSGNSEYSDFFLSPQDQDFDNRLSRVRLAWSQGPWRSALAYSRFLDRIEQGELAFDPEDFVETERDLIDWQQELDLFGWLELTGGLSLVREQTSGRSFGAILESAPGRGNADRDEDAIYLQAGLDLGAHHLLAAGRRTDHEDFGGVNSWNLEWSSPLGERWSVVAGLGRGFRAPSTTDLYAFGGNPELDPEVSRSADLGFRYRAGPAQELGLALFRTEIDDLIVFVDPDGFTGPLPGRNENVGDARIEGAELSWRNRFAQWSLATTLLLQRPQDPATGEQLLRRARRSASASLVRSLGEHELGLRLLAAGERRDVGGARLAGYVLAELTARFALAERWTLRARIENLLDQDYELVEGYNTAGRGLYASLTYSY